MDKDAIKKAIDLPLHLMKVAVMRMNKKKKRYTTSIIFSKSPDYVVDFGQGLSIFY